MVAVAVVAILLSVGIPSYREYQADTSVRSMSVPVALGAGAQVRRVGWREIF